MPLLSWNDKYSVGMTNIDDQHKQLIGLLNKLYDAMKEGKSKDKLGSILKELIDYTSYHFKTEEDLFDRYAYRDKLSHIREHNAFKEKVVDFNDKFTSGQSILSVELMNLLKNWIDKHIMEVDKKYINSIK